MGAVTKDFLVHGVPKDYDGKTWIEKLFVKQTLAEKMKNEGDFVSEVPVSKHGLKAAANNPGKGQMQEDMIICAISVPPL